MEIRRRGLFGVARSVLVLLAGLWLVAHGSAEGDAVGSQGKVCIVRPNERCKVDDSTAIATPDIAYGGKVAISDCVDTCTALPDCQQAVWDAHGSKCYMNKQFTESASSLKEPEGVTTTRCEPTPGEKTKQCKVFQMSSHAIVSEGNRIDTADAKYGAEVDTENECLTACALQDNCMESTWSQKDKKCYPSKQAVVHGMIDGAGDIWTVQCIVMSEDKIKNINKNIVPAGNSTHGNSTQAAAQEIDAALQHKKKPPTTAESKQNEEEAKLAAKQAKEDENEKKQELETEKAEKNKVKLKLKAAEAESKAAAAVAKKAQGEAKKKADQVAKAAEQKEKEDKKQQAALKKEGADKKEKKVKAEEIAKKAGVKKEKAEKEVKMAKLVKEKSIKSDKWHGKGHLLFAQGIKYQALLDQYSKSNNKLDAYHYKRELETYTTAFPGGFTSPLGTKDGKLGKTTPAGVDVIMLE